MLSFYSRFAISLLLWLPTSAQAYDYITFSKSRLNVSNTSTTYIQPFGGTDTNGTLSVSECVMPTSGTISNLTVEMAAPGSGKTREITVMKNGSTTAITCTLSGVSDQQCQDTSNTATFSAGDTISIRHVPSGTPTASRSSQSIMVSTDTRDYTILCGTSLRGRLDASSSRYLTLAGDRDTLSTFDFDSELIIPGEFTVRNLYVELAGSPGSGKSYDFTIRKNATDSSVTCSIADSATTCSDTSNTVDVSADDSITLEGTPTSAPSPRQIQAGVVLEAKRKGTYIIPANVNDAMANNTTQYNQVWHGFKTWSTTESIHETNGQPRVRFLKIYVELSGIPDGASYDLTLRSEKSDTDITCSVVLTNTFCNGSGFELVNLFDGVNTKQVPQLLPVSRTAHISYLAEVPSRRIMLMGD